LKSSEEQMGRFIPLTTAAIERGAYRWTVVESGRYYGSAVTPSAFVYCAGWVPPPSQKLISKNHSSMSPLLMRNVTSETYGRAWELALLFQYMVAQVPMPGRNNGHRKSYRFLLTPLIPIYRDQNHPGSPDQKHCPERPDRVFPVSRRLR